MKAKSNIKAIISGGGTGGHIFPAIAIANSLKRLLPGIDILFVGAKGKMEMEKVPAAGYKIIGLPVAGFRRKISLSFITTIIKLIISLIKARKIISTFKPDIVIGVGGYASGPILKIATKKKIPSLIQEQNSFAGITNKLLGNKVLKICVAYDGMDKYFPKDKIVLAGNPIRKDFIDIKSKVEEAREFYKINTEKVLFITGGSLGARSINEAVYENIELLNRNDLTVIWQTGKLYLEEMKQRTTKKKLKNFILLDFIARMDLAYAISNAVVSRSGALTCAELAVTGKPAILIPSPNVAEDHQTRNAMAFVEKDAAVMIPDKDSIQCLGNEIINLLNDEEKQMTLSENIKKLAIPDADDKIAGEILKILKN